MKKTLQKELKFQSLPNEIEIVSSAKRKESISMLPNLKTLNIIEETKNTKINEEFAIIQTMSPTTTIPAKNNSKTKQTQQSSLSNDNEINFKYLKHVVLKFVTSREYEVSKER